MLSPLDIDFATPRMFELASLRGWRAGRGAAWLIA
jgi:hypothetical protein